MCVEAMCVCRGCVCTHKRARNLPPSEQGWAAATGYFSNSHDARELQGLRALGHGFSALGKLTSSVPGLPAGKYLLEEVVTAFIHRVSALSHSLLIIMVTVSWTLTFMGTDSH